MGLFGNLFGSKKRKAIDADFGAIESFSTRGDDVGWQVNRTFLDTAIEILIAGDKDGIAKNQKQLLLEALKNEAEIKAASEKALKEQFDNAEIEFVSIAEHFDVKGISVDDRGFELTFQEKESPYYFFNVHFENNKMVGVSIDG